MRRTTRTAAALALAFALAAFAAPPAARAQPRRGAEPQPKLAAIPGGGTELFRALLDREGVKPVTVAEVRNLVPDDDLIVIVIGSPNFGFNIDPMRWVRRAVESNGAALVASDSRVQLHAHDQNPGIENPIGWFGGNTLTANWQECHKGLPECPYVIPVSPEEMRPPVAKPGRVWGVFRGLNKLATNKPTYISEPFRFQKEYQYPLARLPKSSVTQFNQRFQNPPLFAVGGDGPEFFGRPGYSFLAVADSSVYINQMIMEVDADNYAFTERTIEYLQGPGKHRKKCLFLENGRVIDKFDGLKEALARPKPKVPPDAVPNMGPLFGKNQDKLVELGNRLADQMQSKDALHNMLVGPVGTPRERRRFAEYAEATAVLLAVFVALMLLRRSIRARHATDVPPAPVTGAGSASTGPPGVFERRQKELVRRNNLYEPVRNLLRKFFDSVGAPPDPGPRMPKLFISNNVRKPDSLRQALRDMWRIAYGPPMYISAQRWFELEPYFERLRHAHEDGKWRFETEEA